MYNVLQQTAQNVLKEVQKASSSVAYQQAYNNLKKNQEKLVNIFLHSNKNCLRISEEYVSFFMLCSKTLHKLTALKIYLCKETFFP